ncbi:MAG: DUF58 domain-containing protein [Myxococcota bacterium]
MSGVVDVDTPRNLWDAEVLSRVRHLHLRARYLTTALLQGEHRSLRVGQAIEFADYQEYLPGMDLRGLDWRVWGRTDRFVVKRFETETELPCTIVVDLSGDLGTGRQGRTQLPDLGASKAGYALVLAASLLYFLHRHGEPVGLEIVAGDGISHRSIPPRGGRNHLQYLFLQLALVRPGGRADLRQALTNVGARTRRRSFVGVLSDGMEEPSHWLPALSAFARRGADLRFFHLYDPGELRLDFETPSLFYSPEGGEELAVDPQGAVAAFTQVAQEYQAEVEQGVVKVGGRYLPVSTDVPLERVIRAAVQDERGHLRGTR